jgi:branched-chain amino acid transport system substrate-binding protein
MTGKFFIVKFIRSSRSQASEIHGFGTLLPHCASPCLGLKIRILMKALPLALSLILASALCLPTLHAEIRLGAVYSTSGELAPLGVPSLEGAKAAVSQINAAGGIGGEKVTLAILPTPSSAKVASRDIRNAVAKDPSIDAFFGLSDSDLARAAGNAACSREKVFVTSGATSPRLPAQSGPRVFLACFGDNAQAAVAAEWLAKTRGAKKVAILYDNSKTYTKLLHVYFSEAFRHHGGEIIGTLPFAGGTEPKIPSFLLKADAVYLASETALEAKPIIKALRSAGFKGPILGGDGYDAPNAWANTPLAHDVWYTTHAFPAHTQGAASPATTAAFSSSYAAATGMPANAFSGLGRDTVLLLASAVHKAHAEKKPLVEILNTTTAFPGVTGSIGYRDGSRVPVKPVALVSARSPKAQPIQITPSWVPKP